TTLADRRLDRYFSILTNVIGWIPGLKENPVYEGLTALLGAVIKERTRPEDLPGLEAMMPTSPLVKLLNRGDVTVDSDLHVLGGVVRQTHRRTPADRGDRTWCLWLRVARHGRRHHEDTRSLAGSDRPGRIGAAVLRRGRTGDRRTGDRCLRRLVPLSRGDSRC